MPEGQEDVKADGQGEGSSASEDQKPQPASVTGGDALDERGVPFKNRVAELERKLNEEKARADQTVGLLLQLQQERQPVARVEEKPTSRKLTLQEVQGLYDEGRHAEATSYLVRETLSDFATTLEKKDKVNTEKVRADTMAIQAHPDLSNPQSEFYKATQTVMAEYNYLGRDIGNPWVIYDAANEAFRRNPEFHVKKGERTGQLTEFNRQRGSDGAVLDQGTGTKPAPAASYQLTERERKMAANMGFDLKKAAEIIKKERELE